jgi:hypothetical protein
VLGWLSLFGLCDRLRTAAPDVRWLPWPAAELVRWLPQLGCVLYVPARRLHADADESAGRVLVACRELAPLLRTHWLCSACAVTAEGPREWIECVDRQGATLARIHLLPDTDYLMWDAMLAEGIPCAAPACWHGGIGFHATAARWLCFDAHRMACLDVLGWRPPGRISVLGGTVAQAIARREGVLLAADA